MNIIKFQEYDELTNIVYGIVDNTGHYTDMWNCEIVKNISDYTIQNITSKGYAVYVSVDEDSLLQAIPSTAKYAVIISTGTEFVFDPINANQHELNVNGDTFIECVESFCKTENFFIAGHILDRKEFYYELHHQCYIINLELYRTLGCPAIGQSSLHEQHTQIQPKRSTNNLHDDYTPVTVEPGSVEMLYSHKCHGWNILSLALTNNLPVVIFDNNFRYTKRHYYPEHTNTFLKEINFAYNRYEFCASLAVSPFNSELHLDNSLPTHLDQLIVPAAGLNWTQQLNSYGFTQGTVVKFYDYSLPALDYMRHVVEWDGVDYPALSYQLVSNTFDFLKNRNEIVSCGPKNITESWEQLQQQCNWPELWARIKQSVTFEFHHINILDFSKDLHWINPTGTTLINVSNIFNYVGTAPIYNLKSRVYAENALLENIKKQNPDSYIIFERRAADGFIDGDNQWPKLVSNVALTNIEKLKKPTWHMNSDWSNSTT